MNKKNNNDKNKNNKNKMMSVTHSSFSHTYIYDKNKIIILRNMKYMLVCVFSFGAEWLI
jgi:hypothetical protein